MPFWKRTSFAITIIGFALLTLNIVLIYGAEDSNLADKLTSKCIFKFKTSEHNGLNVASQAVFESGQKAKLEVQVKTGNQTNLIKFTIKELKSKVQDKTLEEAPSYIIQAEFFEKVGYAKQAITHRPQIRTLEGVPVTVQVGDFFLDVLIEPIK